MSGAGCGRVGTGFMASERERERALLVGVPCRHITFRIGSISRGGRLPKIQNLYEVRNSLNLHGRNTYVGIPNIPKFNEFRNFLNFRNGGQAWCVLGAGCGRAGTITAWETVSQLQMVYG